jgi:hypothetical protein
MLGKEEKQEGECWVHPVEDRMVEVPAGLTQATT